MRLTNIHSITDFQRNPKGILGELKETKSPIILTVNGKAELIAQDAASYQEMVDKVQAAEGLEAIRQGIEESRAGPGRPVEDFFDEFETKKI